MNNFTTDDDMPLVSPFDETVDDLPDSPTMQALKAQLVQVELEIQNLRNEGANVISFSKYLNNKT